MFAMVQVGQFSTGGVGQFYSGANTRHLSRLLFGKGRTNFLKVFAKVAN
jgi:hypothetical protein